MSVFLNCCTCKTWRICYKKTLERNKWTASPGSLNLWLCYLRLLPSWDYNFLVESESWNLVITTYITESQVEVLLISTVA